MTCLQFNPNKSGGVWEPRLTEENVITQVREYLAYHGALVWRVAERIPRRVNGRIRGRTSEGGIPDLFGWFPRAVALRLASGGLIGQRPCVFFFEVKRPGGRHRPKQEQFIREAQADGILAAFVESAEDVKRECELKGLILG